VFDSLGGVNEVGSARGKGMKGSAEDLRQEMKLKRTGVLMSII
jgi:hypothetical protein